jgi:hypothetical protein
VDAGDANNDGFTTVTRTIRREVGRTLGEVRGLQVEMDKLNA